tara:strand:- start:864 stop:1175 length:312 start_codon:yes stop_codon:yes gene_type:complete
MQVVVLAVTHHMAVLMEAVDQVAVLTLAPEELLALVVVEEDVQLDQKQMQLVVLVLLLFVIKLLVLLHKKQLVVPLVTMAVRRFTPLRVLELLLQLPIGLQPT